MISEFFFQILGRLMINVEESDLMDLIHWARRYCDGRATFAPTEFNKVYERIRSNHPDLIRCKDNFDATLKDRGAYWPYAQDGMYSHENGSYDARPTIHDKEK